MEESAHLMNPTPPLEAIDIFTLSNRFVHLFRRKAQYDLSKNRIIQHNYKNKKSLASKKAHKKREKIPHESG